MDLALRAVRCAATASLGRRRRDDGRAARGPPGEVEAAFWCLPLEVQMKQIKAFVRPSQIEYVIKGLEDAGVCGLTVTPVDWIGAVAEREAEVSTDYMERYMKVHKLEVVCRGEEAERIVELIRRLAHTGQPGDGLIFVTPVESAVKIRTGQRDREALAPPVTEGDRAEEEAEDQ